MKVSPTLPSGTRPARRLERNRHRQRLGGVCAGIADYFGVDVLLVRLFFVLSIFFSASMTVWLYLALWFLLPASVEAPIPDVSWELRRDLKRMGKQMKRLHRKHASEVADLAQEAFDAIKILAPRFERPTTADDRALVEAALVRFPTLLDNLIARPAAAFSRWSEQEGTLHEQLRELRDQFQEACLRQLDSDARSGAGFRAEPATAELAAFRERLGPLTERLRQSSGPETLAALQAIEDKLGFLLERLEQSNEILDLRPFEVRKIAFEYLPDAVNQYLQLPASLARTQTLGSGKTAEQSLNEQLQLLDNTLQDLTRSLFEKDAAGLLVHGRFLKEKFAEQPFQLESRDGATGRLR